MHSTSWSEFAHVRHVVGGVSLHARVGGSGPPAVLLHGCPQHSLMWHTIAPLLAERFTVICPDSRGMGGSQVMPGGYDKSTLADDLAGLLDAMGHGSESEESVRLFGYDLGAGTATAFARKFPDRVAQLAVAEFALPGFGYEEAMQPKPDWTTSSNWQLALFAVPTVAEWLMHGREREMLDWFFHHASFAGAEAVPAEHVAIYERQLTRPGALRAMIEHYAAVWTDAEDNAPLADEPLAMPVLAFGGEAAFADVMPDAWGPVASDLTTATVERAGHWLADENPEGTAKLLADFFGG